MVLGLLKWLKETRLYEKKKKIIIKTWTLYSMQEVGRKKKLARCFKKWESYISFLKKNKTKKTTTKNPEMIFSLVRNIVYWLLKNLCFEFFGDRKDGLFWNKESLEIYLLITEKFLFWAFWEREIRSFFEINGWRKDDIYWLLKSSCFELFNDGKYGLFWDKKLMERWYLLITEKFLFWAPEKFLFWTFRWWKIRSFISQKLDVKIIFTCFFLVFHDIPGPGK